eukprot:2914698-Prymnesium_polylepis.1
MFRARRGTRCRLRLRSKAGHLWARHFHETCLWRSTRSPSPRPPADESAHSQCPQRRTAPPRLGRC